MQLSYESVFFKPSRLHPHHADINCQSGSWLTLTGFGLTIPVLVLKTWRLHRILVMARLGSKRRRMAMSEYDIFISIAAFLVVSHSILFAWQFTAPMKYVHLFSLLAPLLVDFYPATLPTMISHIIERLFETLFSKT